MTRSEERAAIDEVPQVQHIRNCKSFIRDYIRFVLVCRFRALVDMLWALLALGGRANVGWQADHSPPKKREGGRERAKISGVER